MSEVLLCSPCFNWNIKIITNYDIYVQFIFPLSFTLRYDILQFLNNRSETLKSYVELLTLFRLHIDVRSILKRLHIFINN